MDIAGDKTHTIYEEQRALESEGKTRKLTNQEKDKIEFLKEEQLKIHNEAWRKILENESN